MNIRKIGWLADEEREILKSAGKLVRGIVEKLQAKDFDELESSDLHLLEALENVIKEVVGTNYDAEKVD